MSPISDQQAQPASPDALLRKLRRLVGQHPVWKDEMRTWMADIVETFNALDQHMQDGHPLPSWWTVNRRRTTGE